MELDKLIADLEADADILSVEDKPIMAERSRKAAEVIKLLRECIVEENNEKWRRGIDEAFHDKTNAD